MVQARNVGEFFTDRAKDYDATVIVSHGVGDAADMCVRLSVVDQVDGGVEAVTGWTDMNVDLTPARIRQMISGMHGTLLCTACGGWPPAPGRRVPGSRVRSLHRRERDVLGRRCGP